MNKNKLALLTSIALMVPKAVGEDGVSLNITYTTMDDVPEAFRPLYSEQDGGGVMLSRVVGLKTQDDVNTAMGALTNERNSHKTTKDTLGQLLGGREASEVLELLDSIPSLQAAAQGGTNVDEQVQARLNQHMAPVQRDLTSMTTERDTLLKTVAALQLNEQRRVIGDAVNSGAVETKMLPEAVGDVAFLAQSIFEVNETGQVVAKDGVPGITPGISPQVWLTELKQNKPFYWPQSQNAGGRGGQGGQSGDNPWSKDGWNMTEQGRMFKLDPTRATQLAQQAGTTIGGAKPQ